MKRNTNPDDAVEQANQNPGDASPSDIAAALEGRQLIDVELLQKVEDCRRCKEKNRKRQRAGVGYADADELLSEDDPVVFHAVHANRGDERPHWRITAIYHRYHPQIPFQDTVEAGEDVVRAHARIRSDDRLRVVDVDRGHAHIQADNRLRVVDVDVIEHSPSSEGPDQSVVNRRREPYIDHSQMHPDDATVIDRPVDEPPVDWPEADRQWLQELAENNDLRARGEVTGAGDDLI